MKDAPISSISPSHFEKVRHIEGGGRGKSYLVRERSTQTLFAIKFLKSEMSSNEEIYSHLDKISRVRHNRILPIVGYSFPEPSKKRPLSIVTKFIESGSLHSYIDKIDELSNLVKMKILLGIAEGMRYLHEFDIVHQQLSTDNVLIDDDYSPLITDYSLDAFFMGKKIVPVKMRAFVAPEIIAGHEPTFKSDVYSFGMIMYTVLAGELPFKDKSDEIYKLVSDGKRPPLMHPISDNFQQLIASCWDQNPENRPTFESIVLLLIKNQLPMTQNEAVIFKNYLIDTVSPTFSMRVLISSTDEIEQLSIQNSELSKSINQLKNNLESLSGIVADLQKVARENGLIPNKIQSTVSLTNTTGIINLVNSVNALKNHGTDSLRNSIPFPKHSPSNVKFSNVENFDSKRNNTNNQNRQIFTAQAQMRRMSTKSPIKTLQMPTPPTPNQANAENNVAQVINFDDPAMKGRRNSLQPPIPQNSFNPNEQQQIQNKEIDPKADNKKSPAKVPLPQPPQSPASQKTTTQQIVVPAPPQHAVSHDKLTTHISLAKLPKVPKDAISAPYAYSPFDGIFAHLTAESLESFAKKEIVKITGNSPDQSRDNDLINILDFEWNRCWTSANTPNSYIQFDFSPKQIYITHYTLKTYPCGRGYSHMKNWVIEGSSNGQQWVEIDRRDDNNDLNGKSKIATFMCAAPTESQIVRLRQTGPNHYGDNYLILTNIEFFGELY